MNAKTCKQCGELKPISQFRQYYGGRKGTYTMCRQCERINSREKYLTAKLELDDAERVELDKIHKLYDCQRKLGLQPPSSRGRTKTISDTLDSMLDKYAGFIDKQQYEPPKDTPEGLAKWLRVPLDREPDYYLDTIYDKLREQYRPVLRIDNETLMPVYDESHKAVLDRILERFNAYEDKYYNEGV